MISSMSKSQDDAIRRMIYAKMDDDKELFLKLDWNRACPDCTRKGRANLCDHIQVQNVFLLQAFEDL